jgi:uncharacterized protein YndB with AHSA1/START domain
VNTKDQKPTVKAQTIRTTFSRETSVSVEIDTDVSILWALLTNATDYPRWNSTIISIEGEISAGSKIRLKSTLDTRRTFQLKITSWEPEKQLGWGDGKGERIFTIRKTADKALHFTMTEKIGGLMFPLYARYIPPFDQAFEQFAKDLKTEAEIISQSK